MKPWMIVFRKEFSEVFRDRRTFFNLILSPLLITPLILALVGTMAQKQARETRNETIMVGVVGMESAPGLAETFQDPEGKIVFEKVTRSEAESRIRARTLAAAAALPEDVVERVSEAQTLPIQIIQDPGSDDSRSAAGRIRHLLEKRAERMVAERLMEAGLSQQFAKPFDIGDAPLKGAGGAGLVMLTSFLPYVLALSAILGGVFVANDAVAGEKERGTLETLLVAPVSRLDLAVGKFAAVAGIALFSGTLSLLGMLWPFYTHLKIFEWMTAGGLTLAPGAIAAMFLVQLPLAVMGAGLLLAISTTARNQKEAQTYLGPVLLCVSVLAMLSMLTRANAPLPVALAPVLNAALVLKQALQGSINPAFVTLACSASLVYAAVALFYATRLFQKESVLLKS